MVKLNARNITTLPAIGGVRTDYRDELLPGFFLRVTPQGTRSFGIVYTTREGRLRRPDTPHNQELANKTSQPRQPKIGKHRDAHCPGKSRHGRSQAAK